MPEWLLSFGNWLQNSGVGLWVSGTPWGYPYVQLIHFFGLSLWVGTIVMLDLKVLGLAGRRQTASQLARQITPVTWTGLGIAVIGGFLLFSGIAGSYVQNAAFQVKIPLVLLGIAYHYVILRKLPSWGQTSLTPAPAKLAACTELILWIGIIFAATEIPSY